MTSYLELCVCFQPFPIYNKSEADDYETSKQKHEQSVYMKVYLINRVENILTKVEITYYEQFLLLLQCFQKSAAAEASGNVCLSERF